jgi:hypothetical protein
MQGLGAKAKQVDGVGRFHKRLFCRKLIHLKLRHYPNVRPHKCRNISMPSKLFYVRLGYVRTSTGWGTAGKRSILGVTLGVTACINQPKTSYPCGFARGFRLMPPQPVSYFSMSHTRRLLRNPPFGGFLVICADFRRNRAAKAGG